MGFSRNWPRLGEKPPGERRVALVLADDPEGDGSALAMARSAIAVLAALRDAGYRVGAAMPDSAAALLDRLRAGPTGARPRAPAEEILACSDYSAFFATLPASLQQAIGERWGSFERDPFFRAGRLDCGHIAIPAFRCGNIAVLVQPARGCRLDPQATDHDPALVPPHFRVAAYAWLADDFRADAIVDLGKHGTVEWPPGASAERCLAAILGPLPHLTSDYRGNLG